MQVIRNLLQLRLPRVEEVRVVAVELLVVFNNVVEAATFLYLRMCLHEILTRLLEKYQCFL